MPYDATVYKVVIASPSDVKEERAIARRVIYKWDSLHSDEKKIVLLPVGWETHSHPESGDRTQSILNKQILKNADLLIGIFWTRIGTPTGKAESGTVEEIEEHIKTRKPAMLYFSNKDIGPDKIDKDQYDKVKAFKKKYSDKSLYHEFSTDEGFEIDLYEHLVLKVNESDYFKDSSLLNKQDSIKSSDIDSEITIAELMIMNILAKGEQNEATIKDYLNEKGFNNLDFNIAKSSLNGKGFIRQSNYNPVSYKIAPRGYQWAMLNIHLFDQLNAEDLSDEAKQLLVDAAKSSDGRILKSRTNQGLVVKANNRNYVRENDPRSEAVWEDAVKQLHENELIEDKGYKGEVFAVTRKGYEYADKLSNSDGK